MSLRMYQHGAIPKQWTIIPRRNYKCSGQCVECSGGARGIPESLGPRALLHSKKHQLQVFPDCSHLGVHNACSSLLGGPSAPMRSCSPPMHSVPPEDLKVLLEPPLGALRVLEGAPRSPTRYLRAFKGAARAPSRCPRMLKGVAWASTRCPQCVQRGCSSLLGVPGCSRWLLKPLHGPHVRSERHFEPLIGAAGSRRATSWFTGRSIRPSKMLFEESVLGYT